MNQHHPRQDGSGGHAGTRSGITRQDLIRKARYPAGSQMTTASTGLATMAYQESAATPRAAVTRPGDRGHDRLLQSWGPRC